MKRILLILPLLLVSCGKPQISSAMDCGEGSYGQINGTKNYTEVRECLLKAFETCAEAIGNLTTYTIEGDPIVDTYHIVQGDSRCQVKTVHDTTQDQFGDKKITEQTCTKLDVSVENSSTPLLVASNCS